MHIGTTLPKRKAGAIELPTYREHIEAVVSEKLGGAWPVSEPSIASAGSGWYLGGAPRLAAPHAMSEPDIASHFLQAVCGVDLVACEALVEVGHVRGILDLRWTIEMAS